MRSKAEGSTNTANETLRAIFEVVASVPRGRVITYGQVAELAGIARGYRVAARAMRHCPPKLPWHRVLGKKDARRAKISILDPEGAALQRKRLIQDGITVDDNNCVSLRDFGWLPTE